MSKLNLNINSDKPVHFPKTTGKLYRTLQHKRIVHRNEVIQFYKGNVPIANLNIQRLLKSKRAIRIKTGVYYFRKPDEFYDDLTLIDPLLVAGKVQVNAVVVYHSALQIKGVAHSLGDVYQIGVSKSLKHKPSSFDFQNAHYQFYRVDVSFGIEKKIIDDIKVNTFSKERIILEGLMHPDHFWGIPEFLKSIEGFKWLNFDKLMEILQYYPIKTVSMRLGWLLERFQKFWYIPDKILTTLEKNRTITRLFLIPSKRKGNKLVSRWNLMVPKQLDYLDEY